MPFSFVGLGDKFSVPFQLYDPETGLWGEVRLAQLNASTVIQIRRKDGEWRDFMYLMVEHDHIKYGINR